MNVTFFIRSVILLYVALHEKSSQIERKSTLELLRHYKNEILYPEIENPAVFDDKDIIANKKLTKVKCSTDKHFTEQRFFGEATKVSKENFLLKVVEPYALFFFSGTYLTVTVWLKVTVL